MAVRESTLVDSNYYSLMTFLMGKCLSHLSQVPMYISDVFSPDGANRRVRSCLSVHAGVRPIFPGSAGQRHQARSCWTVCGNSCACSSCELSLLFYQSFISLFVFILDIENCNQQIIIPKIGLIDYYLLQSNVIKFNIQLSISKYLSIYRDLTGI